MALIRCVPFNSREAGRRIYEFKTGYYIVANIIEGTIIVFFRLHPCHLHPWNDLLLPWN